MPLEEQHGGTFDVVLHKMTEDIVRAGGTVAGTGTTGTANRGGGGGGGGGGAHTGGSPPAAAVGEAGPGSRAVVGACSQQTVRRSRALLKAEEASPMWTITSLLRSVRRVRIPTVHLHCPADDLLLSLASSDL